MGFVVIKGNFADGGSFRFSQEDSIFVGRDPNAQIQVNNDNVSRFHCKIFYKNDVWFLEDLDSTNGTFIGRKKINRSILHDRDVFKVDCFEFTLRILETEPLETDIPGTDHSIRPKEEKRNQTLPPEKIQNKKVENQRINKAAVSSTYDGIQIKSNTQHKHNDSVELPKKLAVSPCVAGPPALPEKQKRAGYCEKCDKKLEPVANYCVFCGIKL